METVSDKNTGKSVRMVNLSTKLLPQFSGYHELVPIKRKKKRQPKLSCPHPHSPVNLSSRPTCVLTQVCRS